MINSKSNSNIVDNDGIKTKDKYLACLMLHSMGDTIGFNNSKWEFKRSSSIESKIFEKMYEYIDYGGINFIPTKKWIASDDTIMHIETANAILSIDNVKKFDLIKLSENARKHYINSYKYFSNTNDGKKRHPGLTLMKNLKLLHEGKKWNEIDYNLYDGGSGASMRSSCIGLAFYGIENREKLILTAIELSRITHNSAVGYLGGVVSALFTAFAIENIPVKTWPFLLIDLFVSGKIKECVKKTDRGLEEYERDHHVFLEKWSRYINEKYDRDGNVLFKRSQLNFVLRTKHYFDNYGFEDTQTFFPGSGGDDSVIIAYDCLLDANKSWEKLVIYSMLHGGDTDTTGCIAASWYGALYGFHDVPIHRVKLLEKYNILQELGNKLYEKFN